MEWLKAVEALRAARQAGVLVTLAAVRGHAPRGPGAKMVVAADHTWGTIGGGNLETAAIDRARELLDAREPELRTVALSDKAPATHGVQCCGGKVTVLLEPLPVVPTVAIFGLGLWVPRMRSCHATVSM
jgi:xanthine dehydrogenase accessory factor